MALLLFSWLKIDLYILVLLLLPCSMASGLSRVPPVTDFTNPSPSRWRNGSVMTFYSLVVLHNMSLLLFGFGTTSSNYFVHSSFCHGRQRQCRALRFLALVYSRSLRIQYNTGVLPGNTLDRNHHFPTPFLSQPLSQ